MTRRLAAQLVVALLWPVLVLQGQQPATQQAPLASEPGMFRQYAPGLLARVNYEAPASGRYRVAVWDLLVGPRITSQPAKLPGGAVIEVRSGSGRATIDGQTREVSGGQTFVVNEGSSLAFVNGRDDLGLALRATLISVARP